MNLNEWECSKNESRVKVEWKAKVESRGNGSSSGCGDDAIGGIIPFGAAFQNGRDGETMNSRESFTWSAPLVLFQFA